MIRCFIGGDSDKYSKWVDYLPIIEHEYNCTSHTSTGFSPNELRYAMKMRGISGLLGPIESTSESAELLADDLRNRRDEARDSIALAQRKQKKQHDSKYSAKEFEVGDLVVLKLNRFGPGYKPAAPHTHKLAPIGTPVRILEKLSPLSYRIELPPNSRMHDVVSIVHLRTYRGNADDIRPLPIEVEGKEEYEVEQVDGERNTAEGGKEYLIKWRRYGKHERTWEPLQHLEHAGEAIATWNAKRPDSEALGKKTSDPKKPSERARVVPIRSFPRQLHQG